MCIERPTLFFADSVTAMCRNLKEQVVFFFRNNKTPHSKWWNTIYRSPIEMYNTFANGTIVGLRTFSLYEQWLVAFLWHGITYTRMLNAFPIYFQPRIGFYLTWIIWWLSLFFPINRAKIKTPEYFYCLNFHIFCISSGNA